MEPHQSAETNALSKKATPSSPEENSLEAAEKQVESGHAQDPKTVRPIHGLKWVLTMASLYSFALLYGLDTTIAADVQPAIVKSLGDVQKLSWIGAGFPLGSVATILPLGYAYGLFELKTLMLTSIVVFEAGSAVCGAAPTFDVLILGRVIAGIGGAGMYLAALNFIGVFTTIRERSLYNALIGLVWGFGTILGPIVGGLFTRYSTWRWSFYINLVLAAIFGPVLIYLAPTNQPQPNRTLRSKFAQMDWLGITLVAAVYVTFVTAFTFGGATWAWSDHRFIIMITFCAVLLVAFIATQYFSLLTKNPIYPAQFLRSRTMILLYLGTASSSTGMVVGAYFIPLYFQYVHQDDALKAAVRLLPFIVVFIICVMLNGALLPVVGYYSPWYLASGVLLAVGGGLMTTLDLNSSTTKIYGYSVLVAAGSGLVGQSGYAILQAKVSPREVSAAISFMNVAQIGSIVLALTIAGSVFQNTSIINLTAALAGQGFTLEEIKSAVAGTQSVIFQRGSPKVQEAALQAIVQAMDKVYYLSVAGGCLAVVSALLMKREKVFLPSVSL